MERKAIDIQFTGTVTPKGHTFTGMNVFEGFEIVRHDDRDKSSSDDNDHDHRGSDVIHIREVEMPGSEMNLLGHPVTLTGHAAHDLTNQLAAGMSLSPDADDSAHHS